jgi:hypothetical protein
VVARIVAAVGNVPTQPQLLNYHLRISSRVEAVTLSKLVAGFFNGAEGHVTARGFYHDVLEVVERGNSFWQK